MQLMEDMLDAVGLPICAGSVARARDFTGDGHADASQSDDAGCSSGVEEAGGAGWVTPKGWITLY